MVNSRATSACSRPHPKRYGGSRAEQRSSSRLYAGSPGSKAVPVSVHAEHAFERNIFQSGMISLSCSIYESDELLQFFPTVVSSLGFNMTMTLVLTAPPSLVAGVVGICVGISSGKFNDRTWHITVMMGIATVGFIVSAVTLNIPA